MKYKIEIQYHTGDSFHSYDAEQFLPGDWENHDIIRENIKRIREHYEWFERNHGRTYHFENKTKISEPEWHKGKLEYTITLKLDNGIEYDQSVFWCGYFESLLGAKAIAQEEEGFSFSY